MIASIQLSELQKQWSALITEDLSGLPKEALIATIKNLGSELLERTAVAEENESGMVARSRIELELIGEEEETIRGYLNVIQAFANMGHSGGSAMCAIPVIYDLLQQKNLSPLTDNPYEWIHHGEDVWGEPGGVWQNRRNSEAFSKDAGKTYTLLSERKKDKEEGPLHYSAKALSKDE